MRSPVAPTDRALLIASPSLDGSFDSTGIDILNAVSQTFPKLIAIGA